ncbi:hypothetical protein [Kamptonema formosum]|nr:hypothetical protein [Oscillatoria sp. PCC 10802]
MPYSCKDMPVIVNRLLPDIPAIGNRGYTDKTRLRGLLIAKICRRG